MISISLFEKLDFVGEWDWKLKFSSILYRDYLFLSADVLFWAENEDILADTTGVLKIPIPLFLIVGIF